MTGETTAVAPERFDIFEAGAADRVDVGPRLREREKRGGGGEQIGNGQLCGGGKATARTGAVEQCRNRRPAGFWIENYGGGQIGCRIREHNLRWRGGKPGNPQAITGQLLQKAVVRGVYRKFFQPLEGG